MSESIGDSYDEILMARQLLRQDQLATYGLNTSPEQVLKALQRHPDGLPQPRLMRWSEQPTLRPQDRYLSLLAPDDQRAHEKVGGSGGCSSPLGDHPPVTQRNPNAPPCSHSHGHLRHWFDGCMLGGARCDARRRREAVGRRQEGG